MKNLFSFLFLFFALGLSAQSNNNSSALKSELDSLNRQIDHWVVQKNLGQLQKHYANDFVFTHGTGQVDSKESWLKNVTSSGTQIISRIHDSTSVELHPKLAIVTGTLTVRRQAASNNYYAVRYVRVYAKKKKVWQMVSHRTVQQWNF